MAPDPNRVMEYLNRTSSRRMADFAKVQDNSFGDFLYRLVFGPMSQPGDGAPHATAEAFNPTNRSGLVNLASMFIGPRGSGDELLNSEMPGQFEGYSISKAIQGGHLGGDHRADIPFRVGQHFANIFEAAKGHDPQARLAAMRLLHDHLFGGEVHAQGGIPKKPEFAEPPRNTNDTVQQIANKLGIHRSEVEKQMNAATKHEARQRAVDQLLHNHGIQQRPNAHSQELLNQHIRSSFRGDRNVDRTGTMAYNHTRVPERQAALSRLYRMNAHRHLN